jgi:uncharacterized membrane protein
MDLKRKAIWVDGGESATPGRMLPTSRPVTIFALLSLAFGSIIVLANPPLRGPDEIAHFLRIYSYARGELLPVTEINGRKGIFVSPGLYNQLYFFKTAGEVFARSTEQEMRYGHIMAEYSRLANVENDETEQPSMFAPFAGTEGYNPVAYIPYIVAAEIGNLLKLDFRGMLLLMRFFGLLAFTAVAAYAIGVTPALKWAFVLIAMLPVSLYNRTVLSADGAALSYALAIAALCLNAAMRRSAVGRVWERSIWMTLCVLGKQPQIIFVLLELMVSRFKELPRRWRSLAIIVLPGLILSPLWVLAVSGDIAVWRLLEERNDSVEQFDPLWKLLYMWEHPFHFPLAVWTALSGWADRLWQELIGIVGWQDILLPRWVYLVLTVLLILVPIQKLQMDGEVRARVAVITGLGVLGYFVLVYLIFFLVYTPIDTDHVRGVQGRYFVIALPVTAVFIAAVVNCELPRGIPAAIAIAGSMIAGIATVEAVLRPHW